IQYLQDYDEMFPGSNAGSSALPTTNGWDAKCDIRFADGSPQCLYGALNYLGKRRGYTNTWAGGGTALARPYFKSDPAVFCPNQPKVDAWYAAMNQQPEYGFNLNFQWLGTLAQQQFPSQKVMFIETFNNHDGQYP